MLWAFQIQFYDTLQTLLCLNVAYFGGSNSAYEYFSMFLTTKLTLTINQTDLRGAIWVQNNQLKNAHAPTFVHALWSLASAGIEGESSFGADNLAIIMQIYSLSYSGHS